MMDWYGAVASFLNKGRIKKGASRHEASLESFH